MQASSSFTPPHTWTAGLQETQMQAGASIIIKDGNLSCEPANLHVKTQSFNEHVKTSSADYLAQSSREIPLLEAAVFGGGAAGGLDPGLVYACEENLVESEVMR
jgi:hypothetical protein